MVAMRRAISLGLVLLLFCAACLPLSLSSRHGNFADDEQSYYLPSVEQIAAHWPSLDLAAASASATSPGYSYFLAGISKLTGSDPRTLRLITIGLSAATLLVLALMFRAPAGMAGCVAILPLAASNFFIKSASWVVTDNAALFWMCASLYALWRCSDNPKWALPAGASAAAAIFVRQLHAWLVVPIGCVAVASAGASKAGLSVSTRVMAWLALIPPVAVLLWLYHAWGGLVPPRWQGVHDAGLHLASVACALSVFAGLGTFYFLSVELPSGALRRRLGRESAVGGAAGLLLGVVARNGMDRAEGRWGGYFWMLVQHTPTLWGRSVLVVAGSILGGMLLGAMARHLRETAGTALAWLWLVSVLSWLAACGLNRLAFQRYFEPPILVFLISWLALVCRGSEGKECPVRYLPLAILVAAELVITVATVHIPILAN
jgi:hypothetical protein